MLRTGMAAVFGLALAATLAPFAGAQSGAENCNSRTENDPFMVDVDENGLWLVHNVFVAGEGHAPFVEVARGSCYKVSVDNMDPTASHTITLSGHDVRITVGPDQSHYSDSSLVYFETVGSYTLRDEPSGDEFEVRVVEPASSTTAAPFEPNDAAGKGAPGVATALLIVALAAAVAVVRRR